MNIKVYIAAVDLGIYGLYSPIDVLDISDWDVLPGKRLFPEEIIVPSFTLPYRSAFSKSCVADGERLLLYVNTGMNIALLTRRNYFIIIY